jgi:hypothetical protein
MPYSLDGVAAKKRPIKLLIIRVNMLAFYNMCMFAVCGDVYLLCNDACHSYELRRPYIQHEI